MAAGAVMGVGALFAAAWPQERPGLPGTSAATLAQRGRGRYGADCDGRRRP
jgi:hypothetical protein